MRVIPSVSKYLMGVACLVLMGTYVSAQEPPKPDAIKTALDAAKARQSLDKAKAKQDAAKERSSAPKDEAGAVKRTLDAAKAKQKRESVTPPSHSVETLPMPKRVLTWDVSCAVETAPCAECGTACKCVACVCESVTASSDTSARLNRLENNVARLVTLIEGGQKPAAPASVNYRWEAISHPGTGVLSGWMAGDHDLYSGTTRVGSLRGNGWYFSAPDDLMAEPPIPRPRGIRTPVAGEVHPEKNGYGTLWQIGRKINPPPLPGQPGYENFGYQMAAAAPVSGPVAGDTSLEAAQRMAGVPVGAAPSYSVGVLDRRDGTTTQVPVYHLKADGTVDYNVQPCNRPLRPNPTEVSVPLGNASVPVGRTVSTHFANVSLDHTHTCPKCGYTWDHAEDGGSHNCPKCGTHQTIGAFKSANTPSRLRGQPVVGYPPTTGIFRPVTGAMSGGCDNGQCGTSAPAFSGGAFSWPASGGCANGQCQAPQSGRRR